VLMCVSRRPVKEELFIIVRFYATVRCRLCHLHQAAVEGDQNQKRAAGPHKSKTTQRSKCQVHKSDTSELRWEHPQVKAHKLRGWVGKTTRSKARHKKNA